MVSLHLNNTLFSNSSTELQLRKIIHSQSTYTHALETQGRKIDCQLNE